jgi:hypothetical protein
MGYIRKVSYSHYSHIQLYSIFNHLNASGFSVPGVQVLCSSGSHVCPTVRGAVRYLTGRKKGGILQPTDIDKKTGDLVKTVLRSKHPDARIPKPESLPTMQEWQFVQRVTKEVGPEFAFLHQLGKPWPRPFYRLFLATTMAMKTLAVLLLVSPSCGPDWRFQTPQQRRSQTMRRASSYALIFWLRSEESMSSDPQTTSRSSGKVRLNSNFAVLQKTSPASIT